MRLGLAVLVAATLMVGCGGDDDEGVVSTPSSRADEPSSSEVPSTTPPPTAEPSTSTVGGSASVPPATGATVPSLPPGTDPGLASLVAVAVGDLAERLGVDPSAITVVSAEAVVWPDGGLGCPQPGMRYTQVPVEGALIVLVVDGQEYRYHSGGSRPPFLCEQKV